MDSAHGERSATMISSEERREVAARLRELHLGGGSKDLIERTLSDAIGAWHKSGMSWDFITERLADLIEPIDQCPYYHRNQHDCYCSVHEDMPVGSRDVLLALADKIERKSNDGTNNPDPMRPLATSLDLFGYARCIRKALVVQDDA